MGKNLGNKNGQKCQAKNKSRRTITSCLDSSSDEDNFEMQLAGWQSTPINLKKQEFENFKMRINDCIVSHKKKLKRIRDEEKANNEEMINVLNVVMKGKEPNVDNVSNHEAIMWNGKNLLELFAGPEPSRFGRQLAVEMWGSRKESLLKTKMIGPVRCRKECRTPLDDKNRTVFEKVVKLKYPKTPSFAFSEARKSANQMGLDFRAPLGEKMEEVPIDQ